MKAIVYEKYGSPDVLRLADVAKPAPKDDEVLVRVHAAAANPVDWHMMRGAPFFVRFDVGFPRPKNARLGVDIAGRVEAVGRSVTRFKPGDEVFGGIPPRGFAEYAAVAEDTLALKPANLSFEEAAAVSGVGFTVVQGLRDHGHIQAGQKVLINGASGGLGTFAVQYAKSVGAEVTGVCSTRNLDMVRALGADHVVDYTQEDFARSGQQYDLIFCAVGNRSAADYRRALSPNGRCVVSGFTTLPHLIIQVTLIGAWTSRTGSKKLGHMGTAVPNQKDLLYIKELLETGKVAPVIDRRYPFDQTADAIRYLETSRARGKVIITIAPNN